MFMNHILQYNVIYFLRVVSYQLLLHCVAMNRSKSKRMTYQTPK